MAYALRYYKEIEHADGSVYRLEIHKKDSTVAAIEIGAVMQGLSLEIQGSQGDVDTPIVKTSLSMTFVDAGDIVDGRKTGFWEEFYTPDALMWKVVLMAKDAQETAFRTIWGGYVTPDSFSEMLIYRGSVNIIARDNIGHMQDFPFDAEGDADGLISLRDLVESGWAKIESPMSLYWRGEGDEDAWLTCEGVIAYDTLMNVSAFEGKNWYEAIEAALASYGIVMRYVGNNRVQISSLRSMPYQGRASMDSLPHIEPVFVAGAQRELVPAVKRIEENVSYELETSGRMPLLEGVQFTGESVDCPFLSKDVFGETTTVQIPVHPIDNVSGYGWGNIPSSTLFFNASIYSISTNNSLLKDDVSRMLYLAGNTDGSRHVSYKIHAKCMDFTASFRFGNCIQRFGSDIFYAWGVSAKNVAYYISAEQDGITQYWGDGAWQVGIYKHTIEVTEMGVTIDVPLSSLTGYADVTIFIENIELEWKWDISDGNGIYVPIQSFEGAMPENYPMHQKNTVNTVYLDSNNVILSRSPELGPAYNSVIFPSSIKNGIFFREGGNIQPAKSWGWPGGSSQQMAVWNHLQLLSYFAKPNNLISGTIVNADLTRVEAVYVWHGAEHLLISGRYNYLNGRIESAVLREFTRYEDMWSEVAGAELPETEENGVTNVESGASSAGSSTTYTNTTTVNIGSSGGGGGASYLNDLLDVNVVGVTPQSLLFFNGTEWVAQNKSIFLSEHEKRLSALEAMWEVDAEGNLRTKRNVVSEGEISAGGIGEEGEETPDADTYRMYHHKQTSASREWTITHNLGKFPNVKIVDSLKQLCFGDIFYVDTNTVTVKFGAAESGDAYLD